MWSVSDELIWSEILASTADQKLAHDHLLLADHSASWWMKYDSLNFEVEIDVKIIVSIGLHFAYGGHCSWLNADLSNIDDLCILLADLLADQLSHLQRSSFSQVICKWMI